MSAWQGRARSGILELYGGRFLKQTDIDNNSYVVVITRDTATELLGRADAVGESIKLNGKSFLVIGVLDDSSSLTQGTASISGSDDSDSDSSERSSVQLEGYIPFSTMTRIADNVLDVTMFYASGTDKESLDPAKNALTELLLERFEQDEDAFSVADQSEIMEAMSNVNNTMSLMIGGIATISLLVGGIGVMNIMLVSVTERTSEIGLKKAIGAKKRSILTQFLTEAVVLTSLGGIIGVIAGNILAQVIQKVSGTPVAISIPAILISVLFSMVIGIVFGLLPSVQAANLDPIDALRHE